MTNPSDHEARISRSETRMKEVAADATAAHDRDITDPGVKADAHRAAINALGIQTAERFTRLEKRVGVLETRVDEGFAEMRTGFAQMRHGFDQTAAGVARIATLIDGLGGPRRVTCTPC